MKKPTNAERQKKHRAKVTDLSLATASTLNEMRLAFEIKAVTDDIKNMNFYLKKLKEIKK